MSAHGPAVRIFMPLRSAMFLTGLCECSRNSDEPMPESTGWSCCVLWRNSSSSLVPSPAMYQCMNCSIGMPPGTLPNTPFAGSSFTL